ncbi:MAG: phosphodiester glycosidase family protein [Pseudomonadota bacterium]
MWTAARRLFGLVLALVWFGGAATASQCGSGIFESVPYTYCTANPVTDDIRLWHRDTDGALLGTFDRIEAALARDGLSLGFAMNGGMYHQDRSPVGLYVEGRRETSPIVTADGPGNFGLLPNGVFCLRDGMAEITESRAFAVSGISCDYASQSGPLMVAGGDLHPRFLPDGTSENIRNGVGVRPDGTVVFAISDAPLNFHRFARLFRDALGTPDALYIDGRVSRLYAPALARHDLGFPLGPIVGTAVPAD